jgi:hypothetical protein
LRYLVAAAGVCVLYGWRARSLAFPLASLALAPLGVFDLQVSGAARAAPPDLQAFDTGEGTVDVTAHVMREGIVRDSPFGAGGAGANFGVAFRPRVAGEAFDFGGVQVSVLNPQVGESAANPPQDDESMLLRFQFRESSALLAGDAHKRTESLLEGENPRADLLKIGHHGSATSSSPDFLQAVAPQFAVVPLGIATCSATRGPMS